MKKNNYIVMSEKCLFEHLDYDSAWKKHEALGRLGFKSEIYKKTDYGLIKLD